jgi:hypothetical protein
VTDFPDLKIKTLVSFPAAVFGGTGLAVRQQNGQFYFDLAFGELAQVTTIAAPVVPTTFLALWESTQDTYRRMSMTDLQTQIGGGSAVLPATAVPLVENGGGSVGVSLKYAREDHVHPAFGGGGGTPSDVPPLIDGVAAPGVSALYSRGDHVHPTDTTRAAVTAIREKLSAARTYFVRTDGNDANTGLVNNAGGAFLTLQKAYDVIVGTLDLGGQTVTISSTGTYAVGITLAGPWSGGGTLVLDCNAGTINAPGTGVFCQCALPGLFTVQNVTFTSSAGTALINTGTGTIRIGTGVTFGNMNGGDHIVSGAAGSQIICGANYTISGACRMHMYAKLGGVIDMYAGATGVTTTLAANITLAGGGAFAYAEAGGILQQIGSARTIALGAFGVTGQRYNVTGGSLINTQGSGATYFPGSVAGGGTGVYT